MKKFVNDPQRYVCDAVDGMLASNSNLRQLEGMNVLVRHDIETYKENHVTLITGGGSGHEPAHAGYIGDGMLSCAVLGNIFASPSVASIIAAIRVCAGPMGVLLIVKNYTGDRLNFGMAAERAKSEGIAVEMVIVEDDCALPEGKGITGGRGVAGTILIHKILGSASSSGGSLSSLVSLALEALPLVKSIGVATKLCTPPNTPPSTRLADDAVDFGVGIHGEPGMPLQLTDAPLSSAMAELLVASLLGSDERPCRLEIKPGEDCLLLLNNLGATSVLELNILMADICKVLQLRGIVPSRCMVGSYMTAIDMAGVSLTLMKLSPLLASHLDADTSAPAWNMTKLGSSKVPLPVPAVATANPTCSVPCPMNLAQLVTAIGTAMLQNESIITEYDTKCGDGDCGQMLSRGASKLLQEVHSMTYTDSAAWCYECAELVSGGMGGTSGALIEIMLRAMTAYFCSKVGDHQSVETC